jgi:hypothetical protein
LQDLERQWATFRHHPLLPAGFNTILPGVIVGGPGGGSDGRLNVISNPGTSPNYCAVEYNLWYLPGESFADVRDEIESFVQPSARPIPGFVITRLVSLGSCATSTSHPPRRRQTTPSFRH